MSTPNTDGLKQEIDQGRMREGNQVQVASGLPHSASTPMYIDANSNMAGGGFPFAVPLLAGTINTSFSVITITGASTGTAADAMHQTLVSGALASFTAAGFARVDVTDSAGNITNGSYYVPFGTLA